MNGEGLLGKNTDIQGDRRLALEIDVTFIGIFHNTIFLLPPISFIFCFKLFTNSLFYLVFG